jgi:hypothetical protein
MIEPGIDAPIARAGRKRPMLPFSLIKGKIRDAFRTLRTATDAQVADWLGAEALGYQPERGRLRFSDFVTEERGRTSDSVIERIEIDQTTGSTTERMLAMLEAPFGYGQPVPFQGAVDFIADDTEAQAIKDALDQAFRWTPSYGALRTVGFGRTHGVSTNLIEAPKRSRGSPAAGLTALPVRLRFDRPLCLVGRKHSGNHFESLETVSGAALKGAVARLILELSHPGGEVVDSRITGTLWPALVKNFDHLRFSEARPMDEGATLRPVEPPLSVVTCPTRSGKYFDVALESGAALVDDVAPAFEPDWKGADRGLVRGEFGWPELPRERRTRTAIDEAKGRAKDESLFSYGLVRPVEEDDAGKVASFVWEASIGLEHVPGPERTDLVRELAQLLEHGLPNIGKTRAIAEIEWLNAPSPGKVAQGFAAGTEHVVTLQTGFLMTDPRTLGSGRPQDLEDAYREFWRAVSGGSLELVRYFARQSLYGGYLSRRSGRSDYEPFLVTERGSTFVLRTIDAATADPLLKTWQAIGLPVPDWIKTRFGRQAVPLWTGCPFLPHAGFGEVAIDLECHTQKRLPGNEP